MFNQFTQAQRRFQLELLAKANVVGVGLGFRDTHGEHTSEMALVALVEKKMPLDELRPEDVVPPEMEGIRTDVMEVGKLVALTTPRSRYRPIIPAGVSVGHVAVTAGTLGVMVRHRATGERFLLSNNHVIAACNDANPGDFILQPGAVDGGRTPGDAVARLESFVRMRYIDDPPETPPAPQPSDPIIPPGIDDPVPTPDPTQPPGPGPVTPPTPDPVTPPGPITPPVGTGSSGCAALISGLASLLNALNPRSPVTPGPASASAPGQRLRASASNAVLDAPQVAGVVAVIRAQAAIPENRMDAALGRPIDPNMFSDEIAMIGRISGVRPATLGMQVRKHGRTTGLTQGMVTLLNATVDVSYNTSRGERVARFTNQIIATGMSQPGDSGSLIVDATSQNAVGLLFAGSGSATIFTPIDRILDEFEVMF